MLDIVSYSFDDTGRKKLEQQNRGKDWPVVYLIHNDNDIYISETTSATTRMEQHLKNPQKKAAGLVAIEIVFDDTYNKSVILDFEQKLIKCYHSDKKFKNILNKNAGQSSAHDYYDRKNYYNSFKELWNVLHKRKMTNNPIDKLENQNIFKYSPYNALTEEQNDLSIKILNDIYEKFSNKKGQGISLVNGCAGTGKTVLAISLINSLVNAINLDETELSEDDLSNEKIELLLRIKDYTQKNKSFKIGFVFPMTGVRETVSKVFAECGNGLNKNMIIDPFKLKDEEYDILFVDEAHRLKRRKNLGRDFKKFDDACKKLNLNPKFDTQLDWILKKSKYSVIFYDENQTIKSTDITYEKFKDTLEKSNKDIQEYNLYTQMRCEGGDTYIEYIRNIMSCKQNIFMDMVNGYEFRIFDDVNKMVDSIRDKDDKISLCKTTAGYSWEWKTKSKKLHITDNLDYYNSLISDGKYDIEINGNRYIWNTKTDGWITRLDSHYTIGCIHSTQGIDLNYVGVILGKEIDYDPKNNRIVIDTSKFCDRNVKAGCDAETIKKYILNAYITMMARGIKGCYVYACNENLREYLKNFIKKGD